MQQHGGVSKEIGKNHHPSVEADQNCAASTPRKGDRAQEQSFVKPPRNLGQP
jgi:hypothetical protein